MKKDVQKKYQTPKVSVILSAFNAEKYVLSKIENILNLDYPSDKLEILIGSDGASDKTDEIIAKYDSRRVRFFRFVKNMGKPGVLNSLAREARGTILVFTDVRQEFDENAVKELVANFSDPDVGCVSGELYFKAEDESQEGKVAKGMGAYWSYEKMLRKKESEIGSMLGATGAIYAIRRKLFQAIPEDILVDDMYIPLTIVKKGLRAVFDSSAHAFDRPSAKGEEEFKRKVRTLSGNFQIFGAFPELFNPIKSPIAIQFFSHKLLRVIVPFFLIGLFIINLGLLLHPFYGGFFLAQVLFYGIALLEAKKLHGEEAKGGIGYLPYTFCLLNYSAFIGFFKYIQGNLKAAWGKAYE